MGSGPDQKSMAFSRNPNSGPTLFYWTSIFLRSMDSNCCSALPPAPCPIVVMSSSQSPTDRQRALDHGAACYFWKPTDLDGFLDSVSLCLIFLHERSVIIVADATV